MGKEEREFLRGIERALGEAESGVATVRGDE